MSANHWEYVPRSPRHKVTGAVELRAEVERSSGNTPARAAVELINLSREGFQLQVPVELAVGETITFRLHERTAGLDLAFEGTVRWQCPKDDSSWLVGCQTSRQVDYETLGELFLNDVLAVDDRC